MAAWAPVANIALWSLGVAAALRGLTRDKDAIVLPLWLFLIGNWIDQDYLSPQALGFLLHLAVLALALRVLGPPCRVGHRACNYWRTGTRVPEHEDGDLRRRTVGLVLLLSVALVSSHQLTPVVLAFCLFGLVLVRRSWAPLLGDPRSPGRPVAVVSRRARISSDTLCSVPRRRGWSRPT